MWLCRLASVQSEESVQICRTSVTSVLVLALMSFHLNDHGSKVLSLLVFNQFLSWPCQKEESWKEQRSTFFLEVIQPWDNFSPRRSRLFTSSVNTSNSDFLQAINAPEIHLHHCAKNITAHSPKSADKNIGSRHLRQHSCRVENWQHKIIVLTLLLQLKFNDTGTGWHQMDCRSFGPEKQRMVPSFLCLLLASMEQLSGKTKSRQVSVSVSNLNRFSNIKLATVVASKASASCYRKENFYRKVAFLPGTHISLRERDDNKEC